jgi:hypothetical protein
MDSEEWRDIPGYEGFYQASSMGRIRRANRIIRGSIDQNGYTRIKLSMGGKKKRVFAHRLVLMAFVGPCPDGCEACHNDGDRSNNRLENLRYDTRSNNNLDKNIHGTSYCGVRHHLSKLTEKDVVEIRQAAAAGESQRSIAARYDITQPNVGYIVRRDTWAHVGVRQRNNQVHAV